MSLNLAIVLAAGSGSRMKSATKKQYIEVDGEPLLSYSLKAFEKSKVDGIILVTAKEDIPYCKDLVEKYGLRKVKSIIEGGSARYLSVKNGVLEAERIVSTWNDANAGVINRNAVNTGTMEAYLLIHDSARANVSQELIERSIESVHEKKACIAAIPVVDTIKVVDMGSAAKKNPVIIDSPSRNTLFAAQTPQCFSLDLILEAYRKMEQQEEAFGGAEKLGSLITDDAMVVETFTGHPVSIFEGERDNFKVTTPEDLNRLLGVLERTK